MSIIVTSIISYLLNMLVCTRFLEFGNFTFSMPIMNEYNNTMGHFLHMSFSITKVTFCLMFIRAKTSWLYSIGRIGHFMYVTGMVHAKTQNVYYFSCVLLTQTSLRLCVISPLHGRQYVLPMYENIILTDFFYLPIKLTSIKYS